MASEYTYKFVQRLFLKQIKNMYQFLLIGYVNKLENGSLNDAVEILVEAKTEKEALLRAKRLTKKPHWTTRKINEIHEHTDYTQILKDMVKAMKSSK